MIRKRQKKRERDNLKAKETKYKQKRLKIILSKIPYRVLW